MYRIVGRLLFGCSCCLFVGGTAIYLAVSDWYAGEEIDWLIVGTLGLVGGGGLVGMILLVLAIWEEG